MNLKIETRYLVSLGGGWGDRDLYSFEVLWGSLLRANLPLPWRATLSLGTECQTHKMN
jgi:hypothetical protein